MRKNMRSQNKVEPEFDCEYGGGKKDWPWVEMVGLSFIPMIQLVWVGKHHICQMLLILTEWVQWY
jgi:hypothetical protein